MAKKKNTRKNNRRKKKRNSSNVILWLVLLLIICSCINLYQEDVDLEKITKQLTQAGTKSLALGKAKWQEQVKLLAQASTQDKAQSTAKPLDQTSDAYIKQITPAATPEILLQRTGYLASYNPNTRVPNWVAWKLTPQRLEGNARRSSNFFPDPDLPESIAVTPQDYTGSGWDRGHLCPAGDNKWSKQAMMESFNMTNICPQHHNLNRGDWNELEQKCRKWAKRDGCIYIVAGPIFYKGQAQTIGKHKVSVPNAFFKVILSLHKKPKAIGFIYKNNEGNHPLDSYVNSIDAVERITGIDFFAALPDDVEREVEAAYNLKEWR